MGAVVRGNGQKGRCGSEVLEGKEAERCGGVEEVGDFGVEAVGRECEGEAIVGVAGFGGGQEVGVDAIAEFGREGQEVKDAVAHVFIFVFRGAFQAQLPWSSVIRNREGADQICFPLISHCGSERSARDRCMKTASITEWRYCRHGCSLIHSSFSLW